MHITVWLEPRRPRHEAPQAGLLTRNASWNVGVRVCLVMCTRDSALLLGWSAIFTLRFQARASGEASGKMLLRTQHYRFSTVFTRHNR